MQTNRVSDLMVQVAAVIIASGLIALVTQVSRVFRRLSRLEENMKSVMGFMHNMQRDFHGSHERMEDGEYHHRRTRRV